MKSNQVNKKLIKILQDNKDSDIGRNMDFFTTAFFIC